MVTYRQVAMCVHCRLTINRGSESGAHWKAIPGSINGPEFDLPVGAQDNFGWVPEHCTANPLHTHHPDR